MMQLHDAFADVLGDSKRLVAGWLCLKPLNIVHRCRDKDFIITTQRMSLEPRSRDR